MAMPMETRSMGGINKTWIGTDWQNPDRNGLTKPGSERIDKTRIGSFGLTKLRSVWTAIGVNYLKDEKCYYLSSRPIIKQRNWAQTEKNAFWPQWPVTFLVVASSIIEGAGGAPIHIFVFIYIQLFTYFEIDCFYGLWTWIYECHMRPPIIELATAL
jgi:hypothetical protein